MKIHFIVLFVCTVELNGAKVNNKKSPKIGPQSAVIAIQIIDPHENKTSIKNSKRTIESSLGYGYQGIFGGKQPPPRYEIYKYSQHDIPPYAAPLVPQFSDGVTTQNYHNQGSAVSNYYQPGTVLFSTINQHGQLGQLSQHFPMSLENHQFPIPVIILRVHPNQLASPLHPNLPQNHYLASAINSIDINSLLSNHLTSVTKQASPQYQPQYQPVQNVQAQEYVPQQEVAQHEAPANYHAQQYYPQYQYEVDQGNQNYQPQDEAAKLPEPRGQGVASDYQYSVPPVYQQSAPVNDFNSPELLTHENYPSEKHTQVIFKRSKKAKQSNVNKKTYSPLHTQSPKLPVSPQPSRNPEGDTADSNPKYEASPMYYTVQYSDDQQYVYKQEPQCEEHVQNVYTKVPESQRYVYVSQSQSEKHN